MTSSTMGCLGNTFFEEMLLEVKAHEIRQSGVFQLSIPEHTMPTFTAPRNTIEWQIEVWGEIPRWPDISNKFTIDVHPIPLRGTNVDS